MTASAAGGRKVITLEELVRQRARSERIAEFVRQQIGGHVDTLSPLLTPARVLGKAAGGVADVAGDRKALAQLKERYAAVSGPPFILPHELNVDWLTALSEYLELHPWEYALDVAGGAQTKRVTVTSPLCWVLNYKSGYSLPEVREVMAGRIGRRADVLRQFVISALLLQIAMERNSGVVRILEGLRCRVETRTLPDLGNLPLTTVVSCLPTFLPGDEMILAAAGFSGVPAFNEIVDLDSLQDLPDPLKDALAEVAV